MGRGGGVEMLREGADAGVESVVEGREPRRRSTARSESSVESAS